MHRPIPFSVSSLRIGDLDWQHVRRVTRAIYVRPDFSAVIEKFVEF